jgi:hypothetical protein
MSRLLSVIGLAVVASLGVAACHSAGPPGSDPGDMGGMGGDPTKMHRVMPAATHSRAVPTVCNFQSPAANCSRIESR